MNEKQKKIGILTFHWATNYGAILQAYALQTYLKNMGYEVYIINYKPKRYKKTLLRCFLSLHFWIYLPKIKDYIKEKRLTVFRKKYLNETILYESLEELKSNPPKLDIYICGSDQIWNPYFTTKGEGKATSTYFLDFGSIHIKRIAYAVSFGCENYPKTAQSIAIKYIKNFDAISVRENTGIQIVSNLGFKNAIKLPDPTLLLLQNQYNFNSTKKSCSKKTAFSYIIRGESVEMKKIKSFLKHYYIMNTDDNFLHPYSVESWVNAIKTASIILTNSFHGMVFSLIFHVPFIIFLAKGSDAGMNDRFISLLSYLNLENRIINEYNTDNFKILIDEEIKWKEIDNKIIKFRGESNIFFNQTLNS